MINLHLSVTKTIQFPNQLIRSSDNLLWSTDRRLNIYWFIPKNMRGDGSLFNRGSWKYMHQHTSTLRNMTYALWFLAISSISNSTASTGESFCIPKRLKWECKGEHHIKNSSILKYKKIVKENAKNISSPILHGTMINGSTQWIYNSTNNLCHRNWAKCPTVPSILQKERWKDSWNLLKHHIQYKRQTV